MTNRKLDMGKAWTEATGMIGSNRDTIGAIAGLFFFLPTLAVALFAPELSTPDSAPPPGADPQVAFKAMMDQLTQAYIANWPLVLVSTLAQFIGSLSLLALLMDHARPTVREALQTGLASMLPYLAALLLIVFGATLLIGLPLGILSAAGSPALVVLAGAALVVLALYVMVKLTLIAPVIAMEGVRNPIKAMQRSWQLTKGNSLRIVAFLFLLMFTIGIISALVGGIIQLGLSAAGEQISGIGNGVVNAGINALVGAVFTAVYAAIHRQLSGQTPEGLAATFE